jgi:hypothetical protein
LPLPLATATCHCHCHLPLPLPLATATCHCHCHYHCHCHLPLPLPLPLPLATYKTDTDSIVCLSILFTEFPDDGFAVSRSNVTKPAAFVCQYSAVQYCCLVQLCVQCCQQNVTADRRTDGRTVQ